jgi:hypothetical protein
MVSAILHHCFRPPRIGRINPGQAHRAARPPPWEGEEVDETMVEIQRATCNRAGNNRPIDRMILARAPAAAMRHE